MNTAVWEARERKVVVRGARGWVVCLAPRTATESTNETEEHRFNFWATGKEKIFSEAGGVCVTAGQSGGEGVVRVVGVRVSRDTGEHAEHPRVLDLHSISMNHHHTTTQFTPT